MGKIVYSDYMVEWLKGYEGDGVGISDITFIFNMVFGMDKTYTQMKATFSRLKIKTCAVKGLPKGSITLMTEPQSEWVKQAYRLYSQHDLTIIFNMVFGVCLKQEQINTFVKNHNIKCGRNTCFKKGNVPWSKGTKGLIKPNSGNFKKGSLPHNYLPVSSKRRPGGEYELTKVADPDVWRPSHILLYEKHYGPVEEGFLIRFKDGNSFNITIDNLEKVSFSEHHFLNKLDYNKAPKTLKPTLKLLAQVQTKTSECRKKLNEETTQEEV